MQVAMAACAHAMCRHRIMALWTEIFALCETRQSIVGQIELCPSEGASEGKLQK